MSGQINTNQVKIFDTTLRDGEQALPASLSVKEKLKIALALERLGVDIIEAGFPVSSPGDFKSVQTIAREIKNVPVLFIPLHHFDPSSDLISAVEQFAREERFLSGSPLDATSGKERLLIIFDGLDELSQQGKAAAETALSFVDEVVAKIDRFNGNKFQRQVLITGRDMAIQSASNKLREERQILHVLPYFITERDVKDRRYVDDKGLLKEDQRNQWWKNYGVAKGLPNKGLPEALSIDRLTAITREPLLNYLVALSYERKKISFSEQTTLNEIYLDLLHAVHDRQWDHGCHAGSKNLEIDQFIRILEEISLAVWHGDGRTATVNQILSLCENNSLIQSLDAFQEGAKNGVFRLLMAFYFRQSEQLQEGDKTFEFTHKSFGEYLIARRIVRSIKQIHGELMRHDEDTDSGIDEREALKRWAKICGPTGVNNHVFKFLCDEIASYSDELIGWQQTYVRLLVLL